MTTEPVFLTDPIARRVYTEFVEMPGMRLTLRQAQRLFGLDASDCEAVLDALVTGGLLRALDGFYTSAGNEAPIARPPRRPPLADVATLLSATLAVVF